MDHLKKHHNHYHHHHHSPFNVVRYLFFIIFLLSVCLLSVSVATNTRTRSTATASFCSDILCPLTTKMHPSIQETEIIKPNKEEMAMGASSARRYLTGPGSSPPRCTSKCGRCTPCKPVHVPVPPGTPVTAEYYPEAWRCKCGNKLYMP